MCGLNTSVTLTPGWQTFTHVFRCVDPEPGHVRISFNFNNQLGKFWLATVSLRPGGGLGLGADVRALPDGPHPLSEPAAQAVRDGELLTHLEGRWSLDEAVEKIKINSRRLAKHQRTWHKRFRHIQWHDLTEDVDLERVADEIVDTILGDER